MWDVACDTNELIYETETGSQMQSTKTYQWAEGGERGQPGQRIKRYKPLCIK